MRDLPRLVEKEVKSYLRILRAKLNEEIDWTTAENFTSIYDSIRDLFPDPENEPKGAAAWLAPPDRASVPIVHAEH